MVRTRPLPGIAQDADLTVRAARLLQRHGGVRRGARLWVDKHIPAGAGLGGGSSDAATVLVVLNRLWGTGLSSAALQALGVQLGADVPVFVAGQAAWAEGIGERLRPLLVPQSFYVLMLPPVRVSTAAVYRAAELTRDTPPIKIRDFLAGRGRNDLEPVVCRRDRKSTRLNSSHTDISRMPSSA